MYVIHGVFYGTVLIYFVCRKLGDATRENSTNSTPRQSFVDSPGVCRFEV